MKTKLIYVTKKEVSNFIETEIKRLKVDEATLNMFVEETLSDLKDFPNDNANQIKYYTRVNEELLKRAASIIEEGIENTIILINRCEYLVEDFCKKYFKGSELIDGYILKYNNKKYYLEKCETIGIQIQRDIEIYRLEKFGD